MTSNHATSSLPFVVIGLAILMATTVTFARNGPTELSDHAATIAIEYKNCVVEWVGSNLVASATPTEMAEGGHSKCLSELQEYEEAEKTYFLSITPPGQEFRAREKAKSMASDIREMTKAHIIRLIIETRSGNP